MFEICWLNSDIKIAIFMPKPNDVKNGTEKTDVPKKERPDNVFVCTCTFDVFYMIMCVIFFRSDAILFFCQVQKKNSLHRRGWYPPFPQKETKLTFFLRGRITQMTCYKSWRAWNELNEREWLVSPHRDGKSDNVFDWKERENNETKQQK